jgi:hypothetical protein
LIGIGANNLNQTMDGGQRKHSKNFNDFEKKTLEAICVKTLSTGHKLF